MVGTYKITECPNPKKNSTWKYGSFPVRFSNWFFDFFFFSPFSGFFEDWAYLGHSFNLSLSHHHITSGFSMRYFLFCTNSSHHHPRYRLLRIPQSEAEALLSPWENLERLENGRSRCQLVLDFLFFVRSLLPFLDQARVCSIGSNSSPIAS